MKDKFKNVKIFIREEHPRDTEQSLKYLLEEKAELEREIRAGEHAKREIIEVNNKIIACCKTLIKNSSHE